jgi:flavin reductase (DIM6/NTAB) family NADH-FMN oxidoreductase RutF
VTPAHSGEAEPVQPERVELPKAYRLINHGPTVMVSSAHGGRRNIMSAAWNMALDFTPAKVCVVIDKSTFSRGLIEASGEFMLQVPARAQAAQVLAVGRQSGREGDKFAHLALGTLDPALLGEAAVSPALLSTALDGCLAWLACRVIPEPHNQQAHDLFIGEVVAAWADPRAFSNGHWRAEAPPSLHYIAGGAFFETGAAFEVR